MTENEERATVILDEIRRHEGHSRSEDWSIDEIAQALDAAEQRGYERGLREGREAERADVVAWLGGPAIDLANPAMRDCMEELCGMVASPIARAEHVPTPQGDEEVNHG